MAYVAISSKWSLIFLFILAFSAGTLTGMYSDALEKAETFEAKYNQLLTSQQAIEVPKPNTE